MNTDRADLIRNVVDRAGLPAPFAEVLVPECPWLDGLEEVNETIGADIVAEQATQFGLSPSHVQSFFSAYNAAVRALSEPLEALQSEAYSTTIEAVAVFGRHDPFGDGDYWVNSDSFSTRAPYIVVFGDFQFSPEAAQALQHALSGYAKIFSKLIVRSEEGDELVSLEPHEA